MKTKKRKTLSETLAPFCALMETEYRGYTIVEVFKYDSGVSDFNVFGPDADYGYMEPNTTIEQVKNYIDSKLSEQ